jgi:hypothetical protein
MLLGSPFQQIVTTANNLSATVGTDAVQQTGSGKTVTLPLAHLCTAENGNNVIRVVGVGHSVTIAPTSPDTIANGGNVTIGSGKVGLCESDGLSQWYITGDAA